VRRLTTRPGYSFNREREALLRRKRKKSQLRRGLLEKRGRRKKKSRILIYSQKWGLSF